MKKEIINEYELISNIINETVSNVIKDTVMDYVFNFGNYNFDRVKNYQNKKEKKERPPYRYKLKLLNVFCKPCIPKMKPLKRWLKNLTIKK